MSQRHLNRWWSVVAGVLGGAMGSGVITVYAFGVFAKAISAEYGWSRANVSLGLTVYALMNGVGAVFLGVAMDKWGIRRTTTGMILLFGALLASVSLLPASLTVYLVLFAAIGFASAAATVIPYALAVLAWFDKKRGLVLGIINLGTGLGGAVMPFYASFLLSHYGWRGGYLGVALVATSVPVFALIVLVRLPESFEQNRRRQRAAAAAIAVPLRTIMRTSKHFWLLAASIFCISLATFGMLSQLIPMLTDRGIGIAVAASIMSAASISSLCSRLGVGALLDRFFAPYVTAIIFALVAVGIWLISGSHSVMILMCGAALLGLGLGAEVDVLSYLVSRYFPIHSFGTVTGAIWICFTWGGAAGMYVLNLSYDISKSYAPAAYGIVVLVVAGMVAVSRLGPYVFPPHANDADTISNNGALADPMRPTSKC